MPLHELVKLNKDEIASLWNFNDTTKYFDDIIIFCKLYKQ